MHVRIRRRQYPTARRRCHARLGLFQHRSRLPRSGASPPPSRGSLLNEQSKKLMPLGISCPRFRHEVSKAWDGSRAEISGRSSTRLTRLIRACPGLPKVRCAGSSTRSEGRISLDAGGDQVRTSGSHHRLGPGLPELVQRLVRQTQGPSPACSEVQEERPNSTRVGRNLRTKSS